MGRAGYIAPIFIVILLGLMMGLMFWPMAHMQMTNLPFAIVSLDEGAEVMGTEINLGDQMVKTITGEESEEDDTAAMLALSSMFSGDASSDAAATSGEEAAGVSDEALAAAEAAGLSEEEALAAAAAAGLSDEEALAAAAAAGLSDEEAAAAAAAGLSEEEALAAAEAAGLSEEEALAAAAAAGVSSEEATAAAAEEAATTAAAAEEAATSSEESTTSSSSSSMSLLASSDDEDSMLEWHVLNSEEELNEAIDNLDYFGALVIPEDYTSTMMSTGTAPAMTMMIDNAKSPMIANMMRMSISSMFSEMGLDVNVEVIHNEIIGTDSTDDAEEATTSFASMYGSMIGQMLYIMPVFMMSSMGAMFLARLIRRKDAKTRSRSWARLGVQVLYVLGLALLAAFVVLFLMYFFIGLEAPILESVLFMWIATFCLMLFFMGLHNISPALGYVGMFLIMSLCMSSAMLPGEMLPDFWRDWIYPWAPQHYIGTGMRAIMYLGDSVINSSTLILMIWGAVGAVLMVLMGLFGPINKGDKDVVVADTPEGPVVGEIDDEAIETAIDKDEPLAEAMKEVGDEIGDAADVGRRSSAGRHAAPSSD